MSKRIAGLLVLGGVALVAFGLLSRETPHAGRVAAPVPLPARAKPEDAAGVESLKAIREAELVTDALARCRAVPQPRGWHWSAEMIDAFCLDYHTPRQSSQSLWAQLEKGNFDKIDRHFEEVTDAFYEQGMPEGVYWFNYSRKFWYAGPELTPALDGWAKAMPRSAHAQLALAMHHVANAFGWRTEKQLSQVPEADLKKMREEAKLARAAASSAIDLDPRSLPAYAVLIHLSMIDAPRAVATQAANDAFKQRPDSFYVREAMMRPAWPMWGGSKEAMQQIADAATPHLASNPRLASLQAMAKGYPAMERWWEDDYRQSSRLYDLALAHGIDWTFIDQADGAFARTGDLVRAVEIASQQLRFIPDNYRVRTRRAKWLVRLKQDEWALSEFAVMNAAGGSGNAQFVRDYVLALIQLGRDDESVAKLKSLRTGNPDDRWVDLALARQYLYRKRDLPAAKTLIDELLQDDPHDGAAWLLRTDYLQNTNAGEPEIRKAAEQFVRYADPAEVEQQKALPVVKGWLQRAAMPAR